MGLERKPAHWTFDDSQVLTNYCETCQHFWITDKTATTHVGRCHRYPPVHIPAVVMPLKPDEWRYPRVTASDACGEHAPLVACETHETIR